MQVAKNTVVGFHYTLENSAGDKLDSSEQSGPAIYLHGHHDIISGLEKEMEGKKVGDAFKVTLQPEDAYGEINPENIQIVPMEALQGIENVQPGMQLQAQGPEGQIHHVVVQQITDEGVMLNGNHPLAGQTLIFDVVVDSIREASEEEISHGHVHGEGGHHH